MVARGRYIIAAMSIVVKRGAIVGLGVGLLALAGVLTVTWQCLPFRISFPPLPWPWYCADSVYGLIVYLAFPIPLLTNDLAWAILFAPLSLVTYVVVGMIVGSVTQMER
jgi:hypothetical protein